MSINEWLITHHFKVGAGFPAKDITTWDVWVYPWLWTPPVLGERLGFMGRKPRLNLEQEVFAPCSVHMCILFYLFSFQERHYVTHFPEILLDSVRIESLGRPTNPAA